MFVANFHNFLKLDFLTNKTRIKFLLTNIKNQTRIKVSLRILLDRILLWKYRLCDIVKESIYSLNIFSINPRHILHTFSYFTIPRKGCFYKHFISDRIGARSARALSGKLLISSREYCKHVCSRPARPINIDNIAAL